MTVQYHFLLGERQRLAFGHRQLPGHQILAGDGLGDGCSTCSRVFISMKNSSPHSRNSMVPAPDM